jgi:hypothetical protein
MKTKNLLFVLIFSFLVACSSTAQQWLPSGADSSDTIYRFGDVGVGTSAPSRMVHVDIGSNAEDGIAASSSTSGTRPSIRVDNYAESLSMAMTADGDNDQSSLSFGAGTAWGYFYMPKNDPSIHLGTPSNLDMVRLGFISHFLGNVGIGTTTAQTRLHIEDVIANSPVVLLKTSDAPTATNQPASSIHLGVQTRLVSLESVVESDFNGGEPWATYPRVGLQLKTFAPGGIVDALRIRNNGFVGIVTTNPSHMLDVNGTARAEEVIVETTGADFVFEDDYNLRSLDEVAQFIEEHGHLPEMPSADEMQAEGMRVGDMQTKLLQKIEELTLYIINQEKRASKQQEQLISQQELIISQQDANALLRQQFIEMEERLMHLKKANSDRVDTAVH